MTDQDSPFELARVPEITVDPERVSNLHQLFKLLDPTKQGLGLKQVRGIFPKEGWHVILAHVKALETSGRLTKKPVTGKGGAVLGEIYTWQEG